MAHLAGKDSLGNECFMHLVLSINVPYSEVQVRQLEEAQNKMVKTFKRKGRSGNTAERPCYRITGPRQQLHKGALPPAWVPVQLQPF